VEVLVKVLVASDASGAIRKALNSGVLGASRLFHDPDLVAREGTALRELADRYAKRVAGNVESSVVDHRGETE